MEKRHIQFFITQRRVCIRRFGIQSRKIPDFHTKQICHTNRHNIHRASAVSVFVSRSCSGDQDSAALHIFLHTFCQVRIHDRHMRCEYYFIRFQVSRPQIGRYRYIIERNMGFLQSLKQSRIGILSQRTMPYVCLAIPLIIIIIKDRYFCLISLSGQITKLFKFPANICNLLQSTVILIVII